MKYTEKVLRPKARIKGGAQLPHHKSTAELQSSVITFCGEVVIPMQQHIGAPCAPCVNVGDDVYVGTKIGDSESFVSAPIHSSVSGKVTAIKKIKLVSGATADAVVINSDGEMTPDPNLSPKNINTPEELAEAARQCGLVGLGGAGFPTHVKLRVSPEKPIDTLIINGAECEPYITADYRECVENFNDVLEGIYLIKNILNINNVIIGIEKNKPKAIKLLFDIAADKQDADDKVHLMKLNSTYPQGAEKVLIYSATGRKLPLGKLPADIGCIVMNITSVATLYRFIKTGMPLVAKRITVDGNAIGTPQNLIVPIGIPISYVLESCQADGYEKVICGGPMMGTAVYDTGAPITKQNNAILAFKGAEALPKPTTECISCGRCRRACPMSLTPGAVDKAISLGAKAEELEKLNSMYCIECGSCAFVCPAGKSLTATMRLAKNAIRKAGK